MKGMLALIAAYSRNRVIGKDGKIPWQLKDEKRRFKELTMGNVLVMGRRTFAEIGRALPGRFTIVLSSTARFEGESLRTLPDLQSALDYARRKLCGKDVFVAGGARLYAEALPLAEKLYITELDADVAGDTYFPAFDAVLFDREVLLRTEDVIPYTYVTYTRKPAALVGAQAAGATGRSCCG